MSGPGGIGLPEIIIVLVAAVVFIWPATRICKKAGYSPWLGIAIIIPLANLLLLWFLALADWPSRRTPQ